LYSKKVDFNKRMAFTECYTGIVFLFMVCGFCFSELSDYHSLLREWIFGAHPVWNSSTLWFKSVDLGEQAGGILKLYSMYL